MCQRDLHKVSFISEAEKKYRLADFFNAHWDSYIKSPSVPIRPEQYKAVNAMRVCRTEALGKDIYACPECGEITEIYHSCKNRFCPTCSWQDTLKWAEKIKNNMLDLSHRHAIFTLPHQLIPLIKANRKLLLNALMVTSAATLKDWMLHRYGIRCGVISVLHTFGEKKNNHMHTHMIVSWGGIDKKTGDLVPIKGEYVNYDFIKKKFRCKFEDALMEHYDAGQLKHNFPNRISMLRFLKRINNKSWIVDLEPPMGDPEIVIRYIGRYSKRACLSEYKITSIEAEYISFRYKNYKRLDINKKPIEEILRLHYRDFFPRLLQHVPLPYFKIVRYYGIYSNRVMIPQEYIHSKDKEPSVDNQGKPEMSESDKIEENPLVCSNCCRRKEYQYTIIKKRNQANAKMFKRDILRDIHRKKQDAA